MAANNNNAVYFGVTRFSVYLPSSGAWNLSSSGNEYLSNLFSDERLAPRFEIFIEKALPVYENFSKSFTYRHIVLFSKIMPEKWKKIIFEAADKYDFLMLVEVTDQISFQDVMENFLIENRSSDCPVAQFRVDDDDILSADYLEQLSQYADFPFDGMSVSFCCAIPARYEKGKFTDFRIKRKPLLSMGLANIGRFNAETGKLHLPRAVNHIETDQYRPVIIDSRKPAFIWTHHAHQDSNQSVAGAGGLSPLEEAFLSHKTIVDPAYLDSFPTVKGDFLNFINSFEVVLSRAFPEKRSVFNFDAAVSFSPGNYRITYEAKLFESFATDSKSLILFLGSQTSEVSKIIGMTKSSNPALSWYRYINSSSGLAAGSFDIHVEQGFDTKTIGLKGWNAKGDFYLTHFKIEKLA